jgi:four helix bundle protein
MPKPPDDIDSRADRFSTDVVLFVSTILPAPGNHRTMEQLVQSSGSISANRQEAVSSSSRKEFIRYNEIALRSAKESGVWLRQCQAGNWGHAVMRERLIDEAGQLARILGKIVVTSKGK